MSLIDLRRLWALHQIDHGLLAIRAQIQGLDIGQKEAEQIKKLEEENQDFGVRAKALNQELKDLENQEADFTAKSKKIDGLIYGGKPISPKEVQGYETELAHLKKQRDGVEGRMLEIMEELPLLAPRAEELESKMDELKAVIAGKRKAAARNQLTLQEEFKKIAAGREAAVKEVPAVLMPQYEALRQKRHGVAMAQISITFNCSECGMKVAGKSVDKVREGSLVHCESCSRILYWMDGVT